MEVSKSHVFSSMVNPNGFMDGTFTIQQMIREKYIKNALENCLQINHLEKRYLSFIQKPFTGRLSNFEIKKWNYNLYIIVYSRNNMG